MHSLSLAESIYLCPSVCSSVWTRRLWQL